MTIEIGTNKFAIPRPFIFGICCGMYAYKTTASLNPAVHFKLLSIIQNIARSVQENNYVVTA